MKRWQGYGGRFDKYLGPTKLKRREEEGRRGNLWQCELILIAWGRGRGRMIEEEVELNPEFSFGSCTKEEEEEMVIKKTDKNLAPFSPLPPT